MRPAWPPGFLPLDSRKELVFLPSPSDEGGLLELLLFLLTRAFSVSMRCHSASRWSNSAMISLSFSTSVSVDRSGRGSFGGMPS